MLYGFAGVAVHPDHMHIAPALPTDWPSLAITRIHYLDAVLDLKVSRDAVELTSRSPHEVTLAIRVDSKPKAMVTIPPGSTIQLKRPQ